MLAWMCSAYIYYLYLYLLYWHHTSMDKDDVVLLLYTNLAVVLYTNLAVVLFTNLAVVLGGGPRVVVSTAAFHASVRGSVPGLGGVKETKMFLPHPRDREVACSASDRQGSNFESCVWRTVSSHHPQEVLLAQFSLYLHKGGLKPDSFLFIAVVLYTNLAVVLASSCKDSHFDSEAIPLRCRVTSQ